MKNNSFGTGLVAFLVFVGLMGLIGMAVKGDDYSESYSSSRRSYGYSSGSTSTTSSYKKYNSTSSPSSTSSTSSSSYSGTGKNYSSSSGSSRYRTQDSYDDGDEEVYDDFDHDIDRYYEDDDMPMVALHWEKYFQFIREKYNKLYKEPLPTITPHVCRHTFCTKMAKAGMNPAKLKYIMGHSSMEITFDTYTHLQVDDVKEEMYIMMQKENELMHQEEIVEQLASEEEMEMFNF